MIGTPYKKQRMRRILQICGKYQSNTCDQNVDRALLFNLNFPTFFWSCAVLHKVFLINRVLIPLLKRKSLYQVLYESLLDIHSFKVFGCLCYAFAL